MNRSVVNLAGNDIIKVFNYLFGVKENEIETIHKAGGMTNFNYEVKIKGKKYILRIPGHGTDRLVDRNNEKQNLQFATNLGINPAYLYFDEVSGIKVTMKIKGAIQIRKEEARSEKIQDLVIQCLQTLHHSKSSMKNEFQLQVFIEEYEKLVKIVRPDLWKRYESFSAKVRRILQSFHASKVFSNVPCHIDPSYTNFLIDRHGKIFLIDWEYSGMFDPFWDIAAYTLESSFSSEEERLFLRKYLQREFTSDEYRRFKKHQIFQDYLWSLWTIYKESQGSDFGNYGMRRFERAISQFKKLKVVELAY